MAKSFSEWLREGEELYTAAVAEYRRMEKELEQLQQQLTAKCNEVNQIATVISKPTLPPLAAHAEPATPAPNQPDVLDPASLVTPYTRTSIARALTGQPLRR